MAQSSNLRNQLKTIITIAALLAATASPALADYDNRHQVADLEQQMQDQRDQLRQLEFDRMQMRWEIHEQRQQQIFNSQP